MTTTAIAVTAGEATTGVDSARVASMLRARRASPRTGTRRAHPSDELAVHFLDGAKLHGVGRIRLHRPFHDREAFRPLLAVELHRYFDAVFRLRPHDGERRLPRERDLALSRHDLDVAPEPARGLHERIVDRP